ncbi:putative urease accessory protein [Golovinomyces cichoracearum]|uniref:Putative urease accessory protein n=1 Tax=Golovinomyces cichoracearum TaxID=62708 RepID=A0A420IJI5_9PEZI|nr:putative urease accessory protein [Golovinomyces cichoracearum]
MLTWLMKGEKSEENTDPSDPHKDIPDTPAPLFVARAFRTALFGTPAPAGRPGSESDAIDNSQKDESANSQTETLPSKRPPSILMTPGTATTLRKKVSFGNVFVQNDQGIKADPNAKNSNIGQKGNQNPLESNTQLTNQKNRKTSLTYQLEKARGQKSRSEITEKTLVSKNLTHTNEGAFDESHSETEKTINHAGKYKIDACEEDDATMDLNKPQSQSGKYWKSEFENYHKEARSEMRKLLSYKELAKSFAKIKDERSIILAEKLKEEQQKVISMEETMTKLSAKLWATDAKGVERFDDESEILIKELARQTARAVQYKEQVEEFHKLMEKLEPYYSQIEKEGRIDDSHIGMEHHVNNGISILLSQVKQENRELIQKVKQAISLKEENEKLLAMTRDKDETIYNLKVEKERLSRKIHQLEGQLTKLESKYSGEFWSCEEKNIGVEQTHQNSELSLGQTKNKVKKQCFKAESAQGIDIAEAVNSKRLEIELSKTPEKKGKFLLPPSDDKLCLHERTERQFQNRIQDPKSILPKELLNSTQDYNLDEEDKKYLQTATEDLNSSNRTNIQDIQILSSNSPISCQPKYSKVKPIQYESQGYSCHSKFSDGDLHKTSGSLKDFNNLSHNLSSKVAPDFENLLRETSSIIPVDPNDQHEQVSERPKASGMETSTPKPLQLRKKFLEDSQRPVTIPNKAELIERKFTKTSLPPDRVEAAKKRLAEKKRIASTLTRSSGRNKT